jgi:predicted CoA-substrate-specific enzyme activase
MITAGCDVGSLTSKAVIMKENRILSGIIIKSKARPWESAETVMNEALEKAKLSMSDIEYSVGTGYGRDKIPFVNSALSEIACHSKGARWLVPSAQTIIDIGGQDCKAMRLDKKGNIEKFITNDKCASGTGRFLEVMAEVMNISLDELGKFSLSAQAPVNMASTCTVWAQADVIKYINEKVPVENIAAGINNAMAARMAILVNNVGVEGDICMTGGVAKNAGVISAIEKLIGKTIKRIRKSDPQLAGAIGAAILAAEKGDTDSGEKS